MGYLLVVLGASVLLMYGILFLVVLKISAREFMARWIYRWWVGRNVLIPSIVMVTCLELRVEMSRSRLM